MPDFSQAQRERLAEKGQAMASGGFPIRNRADLKRAVQAFGRAKNPEKTKAWILKRAKELDAMDLVPEKWLKDKEVEHMSTDVDDFLAHYGVPGMKWGKRSAGETKDSRRVANRATLKEFGKERLAANNGSGGKAIAKSVGKMAAVNFVTNSIVGALPPGPVRTGGIVVGSLIQLGSMGKGINEIRAINEARRD